MQHAIVDDIRRCRPLMAFGNTINSGNGRERHFSAAIGRTVAAQLSMWRAEAKRDLGVVVRQNFQADAVDLQIRRRNGHLYSIST